MTDIQAASLHVGYLSEKPGEHHCRSVVAIQLSENGWVLGRGCLKSMKQDRVVAAVEVDGSKECEASLHDGSANARHPSALQSV